MSNKKFMMITVDNSYEAAIKTGHWKNPGAALYDQLMNAVYCKGAIPADGDGLKEKIEKGEWVSDIGLLKEAYLIVKPPKPLKHSPYGSTPYSRSGCKYPHHVVRGKRLVLSIPGVKAAYARLKQMGLYTGQAKAHIDKHIKELHLDTYYNKEGAIVIGDDATAQRTMDENFAFIEDFISEATDTDISGYVVESAKHGTPDEDDALKELSEHIERSPKALYEWMKEHISYSSRSQIENWKLRPVNEIIKSGHDICHGQAYLEYMMLNYWKIKCGQIYYVEFTDKSQDGGNSHTLTWYKDGGKIYWMENSWEGHKGIHGPYKSLDELKDDIVEIYKNDTDIRNPNMDGIVFGSSSKYKVGMDLFSYCSSWNLNDDRRVNASNLLKEAVELSRWITSITCGDPIIMENTNRVPPSITAKVKKTTNPNDPESHKAVDITFFNETNGKVGEASVSAVDTDHAFLYNVDVVPEFRRMGYGHAIIEYCLQNYKITELTVAPDNQSAIKLYEQYGFKKYMDWEENGRKLIDMRRKSDTLFHESVIEDDIDMYMEAEDDDKLNDKSEDESTDDKEDDNGDGDTDTTDTDDSAKIDISDSDSVETPSQDVEEDKPDVADNKDDNPTDNNQPEEKEDKSTDQPATAPTDKPKEEPVKEQPSTPASSKPESMPKQTDRAEGDRNGVRRKKLYVAFIEWCKDYNSKNTFGSIFDKDIFHVTYPFVPEDMRYFYRLANPILCVLAGHLTFFAVSELKKINSKNKHLNEFIIFAATENDYRVFNNKDHHVYKAIDENNDIVLKDLLGDTFDMYIQSMIKKGDILNGPVEESVGLE